MSDADEFSNEVVAMSAANCVSNPEQQHIYRLYLKDTKELSSLDAMDLMDVGKDFFMIPPEGSPAYPAYVATGLKLILQTRKCKFCGEKVLWA